MKILTGKAEEFKQEKKPRVEEGLYTATLLEVKEITEGKFGPRCVFIYKILDEKVADIEIAHVCYIPEKATNMNKYGQILQCHGVNLEIETEIDTDHLPQPNVRVMVEDYEYTYKDEKEIASGISKVKPLNETIPPSV